MTQFRTVLAIHTGQPTSDGAGVKLTRVFGGQSAELFDPFLMLDEFGSDTPDDYIAGFPSHPHRGFETVTYMIASRCNTTTSINSLIFPARRLTNQAHLLI